MLNIEVIKIKKIQNKKLMEFLIWGRSDWGQGPNYLTFYFLIIEE